MEIGRELVTRDGLDDLRTGLTEHIFHTDGKTPSSKILPKQEK